MLLYKFTEYIWFEVVRTFDRWMEDLYFNEAISGKDIRELLMRTNFVCLHIWKGSNEVVFRGES